MITEQMLGGRSKTTYTGSDFTLNNVTLQGSQNKVVVYEPSGLMYIYLDWTFGTIASNGWIDIIEFPVVMDMSYYSPLIINYPSASGGATNRLARIIPNASAGKTTFGLYAYTTDSNQRYEFGFNGMRY